MKKILLIDGMALLFRGFYATSVHGQYMKRSDGTPTNGVNGFVKHVLAAVSAVRPTHAIVCWDMGSTTFRTESFQDYKANRPEPPMELKPQFDLVKEAAAHLQLPGVGLKGYEADDCIGTLAKQYCGEADIFVLTGDTDLLQLADERITIMLLRKGIGNYEYYTPERIMEEKGVAPWQIVHAKAFMGDSSDNYPGVKGIGEKTAYKLIQQFETVQGVLDNLSALTKAQRTKIESDLDNLHMSLRLAEIHCEVPISCELEEAVLRLGEEGLQALYDQMEWRRRDPFAPIL
ncbi:5'-3' exonuclease [Ectobacillus ponti]|uniref:5'-3' exonuclease n=1 Tax=Ectobacillus ponti TaxID=2961894 RepID=A0AA42BP79_9BACI|nr:5'-3' exonuclease [Ectobacillus ponti]MCP8968815.1 5'-3' exonuclease [Ectobacillus ponti]